ncbi:hypothetical protein [Nocardioides sp. WS12]|uniref:hypothetical protein n=1 Tax=Nocardioides sp. WS12 TaxID=2486272 RepID=UPI0015FD3897|nr:hypothetical protein [Nocardioides sp. WS12]
MTSTRRRLLRLVNVLVAVVWAGLAVSLALSVGERSTAAGRTVAILLSIGAAMVSLRCVVPTRRTRQPRSVA